MKFRLDLTKPSPEENLALDELLLEKAESGLISEGLRFWESPTYFAVLGHSKKAQEELHLDHLAADNIPALRRISGGGTVLQGPGCLNYALILNIEGKTLTDITADNCHIMTRIKNALATLTDQKIEVSGITDLTIDGLKFSGNAMRRLKRAMLFHGTVLYDFDISKVEAYLKSPKEQPDYRKKRSHETFLKPFSVTPEEIKKALASEWNMNEALSAEDFGKDLKRLVDERYSKERWNFKF